MWCLNWDWIFSNIVNEYQITEVGLCTIRALWWFWNLTWLSLHYFTFTHCIVVVVVVVLYKSANQCFDRNLLKISMTFWNTYSKINKANRIIFFELRLQFLRKSKSMLLMHFPIPSTLCPFSRHPSCYCLRFLVRQVCFVSSLLMGTQLRAYL